MAVVLKYDSGIGAGDVTADGFVERFYLVGASDDVDAYSQLLAHADCPDSISTPFGTVFRKSMRLSHVGAGNYEAECRWSGAAIAEEEERPFLTLQFSTTGRTEHVTQSLNTKKYPATGDDAAPDQFSQIGVTAEGVEGVDIVVPSFSWSEVHTKSNADVSAAYLNILKNLTGTTNGATFRGHNAGEVLFLGASGSRKNAYQFEITYEFTAIPNATLSIGGITGVSKYGHEYMWTIHNKVEDGGGKFLLSEPRAVYVERVYPSADFSTLGIGTGDV